MKNYYFMVICLFLILFLMLVSNPVKANLPLQGKVFAIDSGHQSTNKPNVNRTSCSK